MFNIHKESASLGGLAIELETGHIARQADGSVTVKCGGTVVMAAAVSSLTANTEIDYFPLMVNYHERAYAAGKIPGGFIKRETRPGDKEVLVARLIDRPIRPLFPEDYRNEVQITVMTLSTDQVNPPDTLAMIAASAALNISDIPFKKCIAAVRVARLNGAFIANPTFEQSKESDLDVVVAASRDAILMVEGSAQFVPEKDVLEAIKFAHQNILPLVEMQERLVAKIKPVKRTYSPVTINPELAKKVRDKVKDELFAILKIADKRERSHAQTLFVNRTIKDFNPEEFSLSSAEAKTQIKGVLEELESELVRGFIRKEHARMDGRKFDEVRQIDVKIEVLPRVHGSAIFTRGQTQSLGVTTLGTSRDEQRFDDIEGEYSKRFMLHYNFPHFSVGECGRPGGPGRREIGHGNLAWRALNPVLPDADKFPYTIRIVSDILESNGSSSMATVCSGTLSMLQAGVPVKGSVAGIAMGLIKEEGEFIVLSDIAGSEDHFGDMDFKVAGTREGVTALQMDIKIEGLSFEIMEKALAQAKAGRDHILGKMDAVIDKPRSDVSEFAPRILVMTIDPAKIRDVIGSGGSVIREITEKTQTEIDIDDNGTVQIAGKDFATAEKAREIILQIVQEPEMGKVYQGKVKTIFEYGLLVEFMVGKQGLAHVSRIPGVGRGTPLGNFYKTGDPVTVKIIKIEFDRGKQKIDFAVIKEGA
jgi:polyribonucleotide nucleotidyltransferase